MALVTTQFVLQGAPIDPAFQGTLQEFFEHMLERIRIVAPFGISTFITGTQLPTSNQGPVLLTTATGTGWWVWDDDAKAYVPLDLTDALENRFFFGPNEPVNPEVDFWIETDLQDRVVNLRIKRGATWYSVTGERGPTAERPSQPADFTRYWDTDINAELIYERGAWRTVSGVPGDIKFVGAPVLTEALRLNPGWRELSQSSLGPAVRGRALVPAHRDLGTNPATSNPPVSGVSVARYAGEPYGDEEVALENEQTPGHPETHWHGVGVFKPSNDDIGFLRQPDTETNAWISDRDYGTPLRACEGARRSERFVAGADLDQAITQRDGVISTGPMQTPDTYDAPNVEAHANEGPRLALWCLIKE